METKTMKGQVLVRYSGKDEAQTLYDQLIRNGYRNPQGLTAENYSFPAVVIEAETKIFFGTNTACMAAAASKGIRPIGIAEFLVSLPNP